MPTKTWAIGEETLAADFNLYVQQQVIAGYPTAAARTAGLASPVRGQASYLATSNETEGIEFWDGVAWRKPWNMPWGFVAQATNFGASAAIGATEAAMMSGLTFNAPGGRRYRITIDATVQGSVLGDLFRFAVYRGIGIAGTKVKNGPAYTNPNSNAWASAVVVAYDTPPANAAMSYTLSGLRAAGTGTIQLIDGATFGNNMLIEDIGPAAAAVPTAADEEPEP